MNFLVNIGAKLAGISKVWDFLDGKKTYVSGGISLLSGTTILLQEILKLISDKNAAEVLAFFKGLPQDAGLQAIVMGLGLVGLRHAIAKADVPAPSQP